jgi:hypothetical protein
VEPFAQTKMSTKTGNKKSRKTKTSEPKMDIIEDEPVKETKTKAKSKKIVTEYILLHSCKTEEEIEAYKREYLGEGIRMERFDASRLVLEEPFKKQYVQKGKPPITVVKSCVYYRSKEDDELCIPLTCCPKNSGSFWETHPLTTGGDAKEEEKESLTGYSFLYNLTSQETMDDLRPHEAAHIEMLDNIYNTVAERIEEFYSNPKTKVLLPRPTTSSMTEAKSDASSMDLSKTEERNLWLKPLYSRPKIKEGKEKGNPDATKPFNMQSKVITFGRDEKLVVKTQVTDPEGEVLDISDIVGNFGKTKPYHKYDMIYYGGHGETGRGASIQVKLEQCKYSPMTRKSAPLVMRYKGGLPGAKNREEKKKVNYDEGEGSAESSLSVLNKTIKKKGIVINEDEEEN